MYLAWRSCSSDAVLVSLVGRYQTMMRAPVAGWSSSWRCQPREGREAIEVYIGNVGLGWIGCGYAWVSLSRKYFSCL